MKGPYRQVMPLDGPFTVNRTVPHGVYTRKVTLLESGKTARWRRKGPILTIEVPSIRLHEVVAVDLS
jgi:hypothetical protein